MAYDLLSGRQVTADYSCGAGDDDDDDDAGAARLANRGRRRRILDIPGATKALADVFHGESRGARSDRLTETMGDKRWR